MKQNVVAVGLTAFAIGFTMVAGMMYIGTLVTAQDSVITPDELNERGQAVTNRSDKVFSEINSDYEKGKFKPEEIKAISFYAMESNGLLAAARAEFAFCSDDVIAVKCEQSAKHLSEVELVLDAMESFHKLAGTQEVQK